MDNWPLELETLRGLATVKGLVLPVQDFKTGLNQMLQVIKKRVPNVQKAVGELETLENLGLKLQPESSCLWGSRRQVNQKHRRCTRSSRVEMGEAGRECVCCARWYNFYVVRTSIRYTLQRIVFM